MAWLSTDINFNPPRICLVIPEGANVFTLGVQKLLQEYEHAPGRLAQALEAHLSKLTNNQYPDLVVLGIRFDYASCSWQLLLSHPAFPRLEPGFHAPQCELRMTGEPYGYCIEGLNV
jgi:hypothetical protein